MDTPTELEIVAPIDAQLVKFAGTTGLEQASTTPLVEAFRPVFVEARKVLGDAQGVAESVKDATCVSEIKQARVCRLAIRRVRIEGEKVKKTQKANALAYGRAVDGFYNILLADIDPVEKALQDAEDTAARAETKRKDEIEAGRKAALAPYVADVTLYPVREMSEPAFSALLTGVRVAKEQAEAAAAKVEADRIAKEKADAAERERIRAENARLQQEAKEREEARIAEAKRITEEMLERDRKAAEERHAAAVKLKEEQNRAKAAQELAAAKLKAEQERLEAIAAAERAKAAKAAQDAAAKAKAELAAQSEAARKEQLRLQALAEVERQKTEASRAKAETEAHRQRVAREQLEADAAEAKRIEAERLAAEEAARKKAAAAPDRAKLVAYWSALDSAMRPDMATREGKRIMEEMDQRMSGLAAWLKTEAGKL